VNSHFHPNTSPHKYVGLRPTSGAL
jgi:hypothetical protein